MVKITELSDSNQNLSQNESTTNAKQKSPNLNIGQDPSEDGVDKIIIDTEEELKNLNHSSDLNKDNRPLSKFT